MGGLEVLPCVVITLDLGSWNKQYMEHSHLSWGKDRMWHIMHWALKFPPRSNYFADVSLPKAHGNIKYKILGTVFVLKENRKYVAIILMSTVIPYFYFLF